MACRDTHHGDNIERHVDAQDIGLRRRKHQISTEGSSTLLSCTARGRVGAHLEDHVENVAERGEEREDEEKDHEEVVLRLVALRSSGEEVSMHMSGEVARVRLCWWTCGEMGADGRVNGRARAPLTAGRRALNSDASGW